MLQTVSEKCEFLKEKKKRRQIEQKGKLESKQLALVSKSTLNRRQGLELCAGKPLSVQPKSRGEE